MKKNVILAVLGGLVTCLACVGIVMLFSGNSNYLKGNNGLPIEEDIFLGDSIASCATTTCPDGYSTHPTDQYTCMSSASNGKSDEECTGTGLFWYMNACYDIKSKSNYCATCPSNAYLSDYKCYTCGAGTHLAYSGCTGSSCCEPDPCYLDGKYRNGTSCLSCDNGWHLISTTSECNGTNATCCERDATQTLTGDDCLADGGRYYNPSSDSCAMCPGDSHLASTTTGCSGTSTDCCSKTAQLVCHQRTYNGSSQVIANCNGYCDIVQVNGSSKNESAWSETNVGTYTIVAQAKDEGTFANNSSTYTCTATINEDPTTHASVSCPTGKKGTNIICTVENGTIVGEPSVSFSNPSIVSFAGSGTTSLTFTPINVGSTTATVTINGTPVTFDITVEATTKPITSITIEGPSTVELGTTQYTATITPSDADEGVIWSVSPTTLATIGTASGGMIAKSAGTVVVTARSESGDVTATKSVTITVRDDCSIEAINVNNWQKISLDEELAVQFRIIGTGCGTEVTTTLSRFSGPSEVLSHDTVSFRPTKACSTGTIKGCIKGTNKCSNVITVQEENEWSAAKHVTNQTTEFKSQQVGKSEANVLGRCAAYENWTQNASSTWDGDRFTRCCGNNSGGSSNPVCCKSNDGENYLPRTDSCPSGYTVDNTKTYETCKNTTVYQCYVDGDGVYHWTDTPGSSWVVVNKSETECKNLPACFEDSNGNRVWGMHYDKISQGYKVITSIENETTCLNPSTSDACYVSTADGTLDYKWSSTPIEGYVVVSDVTKAEDCQPALCYYRESTQKYEFGKYANTPGYYKVYDANDLPITSADKCVDPGGEACYKNKAGDYEWGDFSKDSNYTIVPSITTMAKCTNEAEVPSTGVDVSKLVYVFMAVLMAVGIGFIYYSTIMKKEN